MTLFAQDRELVLEELDVDLLFFDLTLGHDLNGKNLSRSLMSALSDHSECSLTNNFAEVVPSFNTLHKLELFKVIDMKSALLSQRKLLSRLSLKILTNRTFYLTIFFPFCRSMTFDLSVGRSWRQLLWTRRLILPFRRCLFDSNWVFHLLTR